MRVLVFIALLSLAAAKAKPGGLIGGWDGGFSSVGLVHQPAAVAVAQPVVHAAPAYAVAKPAATSYASFQQVINPSVAIAQPVVHAAPAVVHAAPVVQHVVQAAPAVVAQPVVHAAPAIAQPVISKYVSFGGYGGHGW